MFFFHFLGRMGINFHHPGTDNIMALNSKFLFIYLSLYLSYNAFYLTYIHYALPILGYSVKNMKGGEISLQLLSSCYHKSKAYTFLQMYV